ncbi:hypothetical protein [Burkholderia sp. BCC1640]|uniref:hypothetical protein n=1 Tax=Burkholderia sp. BCC1640 TaxID=2676294 RepID=UPI00158950FC|nr:hypothetical protein [Burkholderia sp. BCC1640]
MLSSFPICRQRERHVGLHRNCRFLPRVHIVGRRLIPSVFSRMNQLRFAAAGVHSRKLGDIRRAGSAASGAARFDSSFLRYANAVERAAAGGLAGADVRIGRNLRPRTSQV